MARQRVSLSESPSMIRMRLDFTAGANTLTGYTNYEGDYIIKSYRTEIARITAEGVAWVTTERYSVTTSKHQLYVRQGLACFDPIHASSFEDAKGTTKWRALTGVTA